jgi:Flp pilus assembly pilin Flp
MMERTMSRRARPVLAAAPRRRLSSDADGGVALEYGLIAALIVVAIIGVLGDLSEALVGLPLSSLITTFANAIP